MKNFWKGIFYYLLNAFVTNIPFNYVRLYLFLALVYNIAKSAFIHLGCTFLGKGSQLIIVKNTTINTKCVLDARAGLEIGSSCSISGGVLKLSLTHDHPKPEFPLKKKRVKICDGVWIDAHAIILAGGQAWGLIVSLEQAAL